jgi:GGDEF domain-containing protein
MANPVDWSRFQPLDDQSETVPASPVDWGKFTPVDDEPLRPGNIDLNTRPRVKNADGTISTVRSMSIGTDDGEVLIPTVSDDGRIMADDEAIDTYRRTGRQLGVFRTPEAATRYAESLHEQQAKQYAESPVAVDWTQYTPVTEEPASAGLTGWGRRGLAASLATTNADEHAAGLWERNAGSMVEGAGGAARFLGEAGSELMTGLTAPVRSLIDVAEQQQRVTPEQARAGRAAALDAIPTQDVARIGAEVADQGRAQQQAGEAASYVPRPERLRDDPIGAIKYFANQAAGSVVPMAISVAQPELGLSLMGGQSFGAEYDKRRNEGRGIGEAAESSALHAAAEVLPERLSLNILRGQLGAGLTKLIGERAAKSVTDNIASRVIAGAAAEGGSEVVTQAMQDIYDKYVNADEISSEQILRNLVDAFGTGTVMGGTIGGAHAAATSATAPRDLTQPAAPAIETPPAAAAQPSAPEVAPADPGAVVQAMTAPAAPDDPADLNAMMAQRMAAAFPEEAAPAAEAAPAEPERPRFDPDSRAALNEPTEIQALVEQDGLTEEQARRVRARLARPAERDRVTGMYRSEELDRTIQAVQDAAEPGLYVEADFANLGGANAKLGTSTADKLLREFADTVTAELQDAGDVVPIRKGGDEFGFVVTGASRDAVESAMNVARAKFNASMGARGHGDIPHPKGGAPGVGFNYGISDIVAGTSIGDILKAADTQVEARKKGAGYEQRTPPEAAGTGFDAGSGVVSGADQGSGGGAPAFAASAPAVAPAEPGEGGGVRPEGGGADLGAAGVTAAPPRAATVTPEAVRSTVGAVSRTWRNAPRVTVLAAPSDAPVRLDSDAAGAYVNGEVYLFANNLRDDADAQRVLLHETIGHAGLSGSLGPKLRQTLRTVYATNAGVRTAAQKWMAANESTDEILATEEALADMAAEDIVRLSGWKRLVAAIRDALRRAGFTLDMSDTDIAALLSRARKTVEEAPAAEPAETATAEVDEAEAPKYSKAAAKQLGVSAPAPAAAPQAFENFTLPTEEFRAAYAAMQGNALQKFYAGLKASGRALRRYAVDDLYPLSTVEKAVKQFGTYASNIMNTYQRAELFHGRAGQRIRDFWNERAKPLVEDIARSDVSLEDLDNFLYANFAPRRNEIIRNLHASKKTAAQFADGGSGMKDAEADKIMDDFRQRGVYDTLKKFADRVYDMNAERIKTLRDAGLLSQEEADEWAAEPHYVPLRGFADDRYIAFNRAPSSGKGFSVGGKESPMARGRKSRAASPLGNVIAQASLAYVRAEKNAVAQSLLATVIANPNKNIWEVAPIRVKPVRDLETGEIVEDKDGGKVFTYEKPSDRSPDIFNVKVDGKTYAIRFKGADGELLAAGLKNLGSTQLGPFMQAIRTVGRYVSLLRTSWNPEFMFANFARDFQTAMANLSVEQKKGFARKAAKLIPAALSAGFRGEAGLRAHPRLGQYYKDFLRDGGRTDYANLREVEEIAGDVASLLKNQKRSMYNPVKIARRAWELFEAMNTAVENASRLAAYVVAREEGASRPDSASIAKNLTVNFNRHGTAGPFVNSLYNFANAAVQGNARYAQFIARNPKKAVTKIIAPLALLGFATSVLNGFTGGDDEDGEDQWAKVPDFERDRNFILMAGDHKIKIPMPYTYNLPFVAGSRVADVVMGRARASTVTSAIGRALINALNPLGDSPTWAGLAAPTLLDPLVEVETNQDFTGRPLRPENPYDKTPDPDSQKSFERTPEPYKWLAEGLNSATGGSSVRSGKIDVSPTTIQHYVNFALGGVGSFLGRGWNATAGAAIKGEAPRADQIPFVRTYYGKVDTDRQIPTDYYSWSGDARKRVEEAKLVEAEGRLKNASDDLLRELSVAGRLKDELKRTDRLINGLKDDRKEAKAEGDEAREKAVTAEIRAVQAEFNRAYVEAMQSIGEPLR